MYVHALCNIITFSHYHSCSWFSFVGLCMVDMETESTGMFPHVLHLLHKSAIVGKYERQTERERERKRESRERGRTREMVTYRPLMQQARSA